METSGSNNKKFLTFRETETPKKICHCPGNGNTKKKWNFSAEARKIKQKILREKISYNLILKNFYIFTKQSCYKKQKP